MRYAKWVPAVLHALADLTRDQPSGVGLTPLAEALGLGSLGWGDFATHTGPGQALMTAMHDLDRMGLVEFKNVGHGNALRPDGRDVAEGGFEPLLEQLFALPLSETDRVFLARLYERSHHEEARWADLTFVDADETYVQTGLATGDEYTDGMRQMTFLGDLERKGLIHAEAHVMGNRAYRPTYLASAILTENDPRYRARRAGLIDWSVPTRGFEAIEDRLAELKVALAAAVSGDDLRDIGRRCREMPADAIAVVFRPDMVPSGVDAPSPRDAKRRLELYLTARAPGSSYDEYRRFLRAALELANAQTHSGAAGRAASVAAAQGLLSFVRALQAIERTARTSDTAEANRMAEP